MPSLPMPVPPLGTKMPPVPLVELLLPPMVELVILEKFARGFQLILSTACPVIPAQGSPEWLLGQTMMVPLFLRTSPFLFLSARFSALSSERLRLRRTCPASKERRP